MQNDINRRDFFKRSLFLTGAASALSVGLLPRSAESGAAGPLPHPPPRRAHVEADLILYNGRILTVDAQFSLAEAVAIGDGKFIAVGTNREAFKFRGRGTKQINLAGKTVTPGFIDGHAHMDREGLKYIYPSLAGARSREDILAIIRAEVAKSQPGEWIVTMPLGDPPFFFDARQILEETGLDRWALDTVSPYNPVYIRSIWGFWDRPPLVSVANSEALRLAGVTRETVPPYPGIVIERDSTGEPNGVFRELNSQPALEHSLFNVVPRFTHEHRVAGLRDSMRIYNALGTTSVYEGHGVAAEVVRAYKELWDNDELTVRTALVISPTPGWFDTFTPSRPELEQMFRDFATYASGAGFGDDFLRTTGVFFQIGGDPALARILTAELPYTGWASYYYDAVPPETPPNAVFRATAILAAKHGLRLNTIAGSPPALTDALDVFEEVDQTYPIRDKRWVIEHLSVVSAANIERMRRLGVVPTTIPPSTIWKATPPASLENFAPYRSLLEAGVPLNLCTDNVPPQPFFTLWAVITRKNRFTGMPLDVFRSEKLTREEALRAMTVNGAYLTFEENVKGSIEADKYADLIVIDRDYLTIDDDEIKDINVLMTMVGGKIVHQTD